MLRVFKNRVPREIFGPNVKSEKTREHCIMRGFKICTTHQIINRVTESRGMRWVRHVACTGKKCMHGFCEES